ncbi:Folylpolyglutamate synthetase [Apophysomyces ossiformis]|uniref:Folylpolyglutamate synthase n=1 Tax=Apophysomyces ossiformis TaxID=679940 RepID=A0A8H7EQ11_9FUNG|nr:Folylpolyglutamate synthetase [Apophysomyces ossiformis]
MTLTYEGAVKKVNDLQSNLLLLNRLRKNDPTVDEYNLPHMRYYMKRIGYDDKDFNDLNVIHVTGTKGKGSICAMCQSILKHYPMKERSLRIGLFTTPHLKTMRERVRIDGIPISEEKFAKYSEEVWKRLEETKDGRSGHDETTQTGRPHLDYHPELLDKLTHRQFFVLMALHSFISEKVDVVILEINLGGEYDATNVVTQPIACGIAAVGFDHMDELGSTIDKIAWHKAGIIKHHVPVATFEQVPKALEVIKRRAKEKEATLHVMEASQTHLLDDVEIGLSGVYQKQNALVAIELCRIWLEKCRHIKLADAVPADFKEGLRRVQWPGRAQTIEIAETTYANRITQRLSLYMDCAHTIESLQACSDWYSSLVDPTALQVLIFNCLADRDGPTLLRCLSGLSFDFVVFSDNITLYPGYVANISINCWQMFNPEGCESTDNMYQLFTDEEVHEMQTKLVNCWRTLHPSFDESNIAVTSSTEEAVECLVDYANRHGRPVQVLTTGSLRLVGNLMVVLGIPIA